MRRYFQFSIRSLLLLTTLAAVATVVGQPLVKTYLAQRERQTAIKCYT